jgi:putative FmdB family regulatory protein
MPIYDYVCGKCGHAVEVIHSVSGTGPSVCPKCGGPMKKAIVAPAVHFKGGGWARKERAGSGKPVARTTSTESTSSTGSEASQPASPAEPAGPEPAAKDPD